MRHPETEALFLAGAWAWSAKSGGMGPWLYRHNRRKCSISVCHKVLAKWEGYLLRILKRSSWSSPRWGSWGAHWWRFPSSCPSTYWDLSAWRKTANSQNKWHCEQKEMYISGTTPWKSATAIDSNNLTSDLFTYLSVDVLDLNSFHGIVSHLPYTYVNIIVCMINTEMYLSLEMVEQPFF